MKQVRCPPISTAMRSSETFPSLLSSLVLRALSYGIFCSGERRIR